jgi:peptidoglycan hydrolase-like protein with peptidoglycan-binding domain
VALRSLLFTSPDIDPRLGACLVDDAAHITPGSQGEHVEKIQTALNQLSAGPGRENFDLVVDGAYGPATASAVQVYKNRRGILRPGQLTADNIVGKRTMQSLDDEMDILEREVPLFSGLIAPTASGAPHDHTTCPTPPRVTGTLLNGHASHWGTPINPKRQGRMVNIYGEGETDYVGFVDFAAEPQFANGRPLTSSLFSGSASDIAMRNAPINAVTESEIKRLARGVALGGCRFTYGSNQITFRAPRRILGLGQVVQQARIADEDHPGDPAFDSEVWVVEMR